jgi:hypothetical protein
MNRARVQQILAAHRIRKFTADDVLSTLNATPLLLAAGAGEAASEHVLRCFRKSYCSTSNSEM